MKMNIKQLFATLLLLTLSPFVVAEQRYITDQLMIGLYAKKGLKGEPISQLSSGTQVELIKLDGKVAQVKTVKGEEGWLRATFLKKGLTAGLRLEQIQKNVERLEEELSQAKAEVERLQGSQADASESASKSAKESDWMKVEMNKARREAKQAAAKLSKSQKALTEAQQQQKKMGVELQQLQEEYATVKTQLGASLLIASNAATESEAEEAVVASATSVTQEAVTQKGVASVAWFWVAGMILLALLIGFCAGYYWIDERIRRRFGGLRIY